MLDQIFKGIFDSSSVSVIALSDFLLCMVVSLLIGAFLAWIYAYKSHHSQSFVVTLALLPAVVCMIIMMVNGNLGTGVAVAGTFGLVRFRSAPGSAREVSAIFLAMGSGLATGMGYLGYAVMFVLIMGLICLLYTELNFGKPKACKEKTLHITIPENLDYTQVFDDLFEEYTTAWEVVRVKTTNMGSLFKLTYSITLKDVIMEKALIDDLRCRNGNLEISITRPENSGNEL